MGDMRQIVPLDPLTYRRHPIHGEGRTWAETNCYTDVVIELLHGLGHEPLAALPFTLTIDFDVDQWTFFKVPPEDVAALYALGIHEMVTWRPLVEHVAEQIGAGRPVLVELDSFYLPDTAGTAYGLAHVKSTVAINAIDVAGRRLGYFHNQGYHTLEGRDFVEVFQVDGLVHERMLPPYVEFVKAVPRARALAGPALVEASRGLLRRHLARIPPVNPFFPFKERFERDVDWLIQSEMAVFHAYSFATLRQFGACFELAATYLRWLPEPGTAAGAFDEIARSTKRMQFQLARSMARRRALDLSPLDGMASLWDRGMSELTDRYG